VIEYLTHRLSLQEEKCGPADLFRDLVNVRAIHPSVELGFVGYVERLKVVQNFRGFDVSVEAEWYEGNPVVLCLSRRNHHSRLHHSDRAASGPTIATAAEHSISQRYSSVDQNRPGSIPKSRNTS
jgi:hypothetical protein